MVEPRGENLEPAEAVISPEAVVDNAVEPAEVAAAADPVISSKWGQKAKSFFSTSKEYAGVGLEYGHQVALPIVLGIVLFGLAGAAKAAFGVLDFAKAALSGKMSFDKGAALGEKAVTFKEKKGK